MSYLATANDPSVLSASPLKIADTILLQNRIRPPGTPLLGSLLDPKPGRRMAIDVCPS